MLVDRARIRRRTYVFIGAWQGAKTVRVRKQDGQRDVP